MAEDKQADDRVDTGLHSSGREEKVVPFQPRPKARSGPLPPAPPNDGGPSPDPGPTAA